MVSLRHLLDLTRLLLLSLPKLILHSSLSSRNLINLYRVILHIEFENVLPIMVDLAVENCRDIKNSWDAMDSRDHKIGIGQ
jgi:hypothetical protein